MGTLQHTDLRAEVLSALGSRDDLTDAGITRVLNLMQERLARIRDWEELRFQESVTSTFTGTKLTDKFLNFSEFSVNHPFKEIWTFRVITGEGDSNKLEKIPTRLWDEKIPEPEYFSTSTPRWYTVWKDKFELWRIPEKAYTFDLRGTAWPTVLSGDTDLSDFDKKDDLLIWLTISYLWNQKGEYQRADRFFGMFKGAFEEAQFEDQTEPDEVIKPAHQIKSNQFRNRDYWLDPTVKGAP